MNDRGAGNQEPTHLSSVYCACFHGVVSLINVRCWLGEALLRGRQLRGAENIRPLPLWVSGKFHGGLRAGLGRLLQPEPTVLGPTPVSSPAGGNGFTGCPWEPAETYPGPPRCSSSAPPRPHCLPGTSRGLCLAPGSGSSSASSRLGREGSRLQHGYERPSVPS